MLSHETLKGLVASAPMARRTGISLQHQVYLVLRGLIVSGRIGDGERLPTEVELTRVFGVSRVTVRGALELLCREQFLDKHQGRGTIVCGQRIRERVQVANVELLDHVQLVGTTTTVRLIEASFVTPTAELQDFFKCKAGEKLQRIVRLRSGESGPIFHVVTYLGPVVGVLTRRELKAQSLLQTLRSKGIRLTRGRQVISATAADPTLAASLNAVSGAPLIRIRRFHCDHLGRAIQYIELHASPDSFEIEMAIGMERAED